MSFKIGNFVVGSGRALLIAEIAQAHDGSLGLAHAYIDAASDAGADAVKFQTHIAGAESTRDEVFRVNFSRQDATRYDYWKRMEFTPDQWRGLSEHAREKGLIFLSSAFSTEAVQMLAALKVPAWKIASGEVGSLSAMDPMLATGAPFVVSSGMSSWDEIEAIVARIRAAGRELALLQCTTAYPTPLDAIGLNVIPEMRKRFGLGVGLSDHSGSPYPAIAALARGADIIELHLTLDRGMFGPDVSSSLTVSEFRSVAEFRDALVTMDGHPVDKDKVADELAPLKTMFGRSLAPKLPLSAGTRIDAAMLSAKKPGGGISERDINRVIGLRLSKNVAPDRLLRWDDLEKQ